MVFGEEERRLAYVALSRARDAIRKRGRLQWLFGSSLQNDAPEEEKGAELGLAAPAKKVDRSLFLLLNLMIMTFVLSRSLLFDPEWSAEEEALCRVGRMMSVVFLKSMLPSLFYCLNYLLDTDGWMLLHNVVTDTIVLIVFTYFMAYAVVAFAFSFPLMTCFVYFFLRRKVNSLCEDIKHFL